MKKLCMLAIICSLFGFMSCGEKKDDATTTTAENKTMDHGTDAADKAKLDAFNTVSDAFKTGDVSKIDAVVAEDFVDHSDRGDVKGRDSLKAMITLMHSKMKDDKAENLNQAVSGDYVYAWRRYSGTSDGSMGMPAGPYDMSAIELVKFNSDNKAIEHWGFMEMREMMKMMPAPKK